MSFSKAPFPGQLTWICGRMHVLCDLLLRKSFPLQGTGLVQNLKKSPAPSLLPTTLLPSSPDRPLGLGMVPWGSCSTQDPSPWGPHQAGWVWFCCVTGKPPLSDPHSASSTADLWLCPQPAPFQGSRTWMCSLCPPSACPGWALSDSQVAVD
jgi:hypothetical protein